MPHKSGIYEYFDSDGRILYIGKAKDLKKRVKSYFKLAQNSIFPSPNLSNRISNMVRQIAEIRHIIVENENDAFILENSLIKQLKPKYNILLRDDKTYPYIVVDLSLDFPRLEVTRKIIKNKNLMYIGPFSGGLKELLEGIYESIPLVQKKSCLISKQACLFFQIKRCFAPCEGKISPSDYKTYLLNALDLARNPNKLIKILSQKMTLCAEKLAFEEANRLKQMIKKISEITPKSTLDLHKLYSFDIFAIVENEFRAIVLKLFMRDGRVVFSDYYFINRNNNDIELNYLYTQALINHYKRNPPLKLDAILLPFQLENCDEMMQFFRANFNKNISIICPKLGDKMRLVNLALENAENILKHNAGDDLMQELKKILKLENTPNRIEVFDTSHHGGSSAVGGMIVFENDFIKDSYRKFHLSGSDEYSQMRELLTRRAKNFDMESPPDLWLLDGGIQQINIALEVLQSSGANVDVAAIAKEKLDFKAHRAKGAARDILRTKNMELRLESSDKYLQFCQKLRDEVHRFAISFHRRKKRASALNNDNFSQSQITKLLKYFGSFEAINEASAEEINIVLKKRAQKGQNAI